MTEKREKELLERIARLEERIRVLEAGPSQRIEYHYHYSQPAPYYWPTYIPPPLPAYPHYPIWFGTTGDSSIEYSPHSMGSTANG